MIDWAKWLPSAYLISEWTIRLILTPIVIRNRRPSTALAWLAFIYFIPWVGFIVFLLVGQRPLGRRRIVQYHEAHQWAQIPIRRALQSPHITHPVVAPEQDDLVMLCERLIGLPIVGGNEVSFISESTRFIDQLVDDVDRAERHVNMLFYIFKDDETGRQVADALCRAARRGVVCRLLADSVGSKSLFKNLRRPLEDAGVQIVEALPAGLFRRQFRRIDLRNHRKIAIIDGVIGYTGSQNIVNPDYGHNRIGAWQDLMMRIVGPAVLELQYVFFDDWSAERGANPDARDAFPAPITPGEIAMQIIPSGPDDSTDVFRNVTLAAINEAEKRVILTTPYFVPDEPLMLALQLTVLRGVRVDLVIPERCDHPLVGAAAQSHYTALLKSGVNVHLHKKGLLHSKTLCVDNAFALVGSGNLDCRSFFLNFELGVLLYGSEVTGRLRAEQEDYIAQSQLLDAEQWSNQPAWRTFGRNIAALMSPLL